MDFSKSFTYVISSDERTNSDVVASSYDFNFGGFSEPYDDYYVEILSFACVGGITVANSYLLFIAGFGWLFCCKTIIKQRCYISNFTLKCCSRFLYSI